MQLTEIHGQAEPSSEPPVTAWQMAAATKRFFDQAASDAELSERMAFARTTVHLRFVGDREEAGCTLFLDRHPIEAADTILGEAEIELTGPCDAWLRMVRGNEHLSLAIARGDIRYSGPVRKFLRVVPILRAFDFDAWRHLGDE